MKKSIPKYIYKYNIYRQLWMINLFLLIFYISAVYSSAWKIVRAKWMITEGIILIGGIIFLSFFLGKYHIKTVKKSIKKTLKNNCLFLIVLLLSILFRFFGLTNQIIWDSGEYYGRLITATEKFDFSVTSFLDYFNLANHPNYGYTFFTSIGEFLFPRKIWGVNVIVLILTGMALVFLYRIFSKYLKINNSLSALLCATFSFSPLVLGTSGYYNPDYGIALFFIFMLYFFLEKKYILFAFWSICFVFTKEVSAVIYFFFIIGILVMQTCKVKENRLKIYINKIIKNPYIYISALTAVLYVGYMKYIGGITKWKQVDDAGTNFRWDNNGFNCFGFDTEYVILKLQQIFLINYKWIITLTILVLLSIYIIKKKKVNYESIPVLGIVLSFISYVIFSCLYITYALTRYNYISDLILVLILGILINNLKLKIKTNYILCFLLVFISGIFCLESYITTDPLSRFFYPQVPTNTISMFYPGYMKKDIYYGDNIVYNNQFSFLTKSYNQFLSSVDYDENKVIVFPGMFEGSQLNGNGDIYQVNWDQVKKKRTFSYVSETVIPIKTEIIEHILNIKNKKELPDEIIVPFIPYFYENIDENEVEQKLEKYYQLIEEKKTNGLQGYIKYQYYQKK